METAASRQDDLQVRLTEWLLDQLNSRRELETVTQQFRFLVTQAQNQAIGDLYAHIGKLIFQKIAGIQLEGPRNGIRLCAELCHSLCVLHFKERSRLSPRVLLVHEQVLRLFIDSLPISNPIHLSDARNSGGAATANHSKVSLGHNGNLSVERNSELLCYLYEFRLISLAQIYEYAFRVIDSHETSVGTRLSDAVAGMRLLNELLSDASHAPWRNEVATFSRWIDIHSSLSMDQKDVIADSDGTSQHGELRIVTEAGSVITKTSPSTLGNDGSSQSQRDPIREVEDSDVNDEARNNIGKPPRTPITSRAESPVDMLEQTYVNAEEQKNRELCKAKEEEERAAKEEKEQKPIGQSLGASQSSVGGAIADGTNQREWEQGRSHQFVERGVSALLNKLTMDKFDLISDQIIEWANKSEQEKDGETLMKVTKLVFEKAKDEEAFSEMYARLCRRMMERVSPNIQDKSIRNSEGQPITGGMLLRRYLLNLCQEDFERGWSAKGAALAAAAAKAGEDKAAEIASEGNGETVLYSEEYYAAAKAKRQGLGLVRFVGELFKLQMLTERIMHECIKKLLSNVVNPEEEEIESLCKLLTTVGQSLDNPKARNHMDIYFERMQDMAKSNSINSRTQFMLLGVIELRTRRWQARAAVPRGANATESTSWNLAGGANINRSSTRSGGLSQLGKISKPTSIQFSPSSVMKDTNMWGIGRTGGPNIFSARSTGATNGPPPAFERKLSRRTPIVDLGPGGSPTTASTGERRKLNLLPRTKSTVAITEGEALVKAKKDVREYIAVENINEAIMVLQTLPSEYQYLFINELVSKSMDGGSKVVVLAERLFSAARSRSVISPQCFERGLLPTIEMAADLSIYVPKAYESLARMIHAAGIDKVKTEEMASKILIYGEPRVPPRELLIREFEKVSSA